MYSKKTKIINFPHLHSKIKLSAFVAMGLFSNQHGLKEYEKR